MGDLFDGYPVNAGAAFDEVFAPSGEPRPVYRRLLDAIATHRVADRPDRYEPRRTKRRPKPYDRLMKPRHEAKLQMLKGVKES